MDDPKTAQDITNQPGSVLIRGRVVFNWANVNWEQGVGDLSIWTSAAGVKHVGLTPYSETLVGASEDGSTVAYTANTHAVGDGAGGAATGGGGAPAEGGTGGANAAAEAGSGGAAPANRPEMVTDLIIAASDLSTKDTLIASVGLGSETTCNPSFAFVGERLLVGWCSSGSRAAKIERYELDAMGWTPTTIAEDALSNWSADATGDSVFYQSSGYSGYVSAGGKAALIDAGVSAGTILPDGKAVLYSVGDQLRRADLASIKPITIVTTGYKQPITFSSDFGLALYSTTVTYEHGTQRDLLLATTGAFNPQPLVLVSQPVATLARSTVTSDGKHVFWLTDVTPTGGTLHVVDSSGAEVTTLPNVVEAAAGKGSLLVFTDNASDPSKYPVVADLKVLDLGHETDPRLIEAKVLDGKNFELDASGTVASYVRSGIGRDPGDATHDGVFTVTLP
jgi:hypothetical protein